MKVTKRLLSLALACLLLAGLLSGCTGTSGTDNSPGGDASGSGNNGEYTRPEKTVMLKWIQIGSEPRDLQEVVDAMNRYTIEKLNIGVELVVYDWSSWDTGINNMLNTGEYFDIMFLHTLFYISHASKLYDISGALDTVAPALKEFIPKSVWTGTTVNGKIYGVPSYKDSAATFYISWSKEMAEKYSIDYKNISTYQQWEDALRKIKTGEEAATGKKVYPLHLTKDGVDEIRSYYDNYVRYDDSTARVSNYWESEEVGEKLAYLHKWYTEGLINPDASTVEEGPNVRSCFTGQAFEGVDAIWSSQFNHEYVAAAFSPTIYSTSSILGSVNGISANSRYPREALKYLELVNTDNTLRNMLAYGIEGKHWSYTGDKTVKRLTDTWTLAAYSQGSYFSLTPVTPNPIDQWERVKAQTESAHEHVLLGFTLDESKISTQLANVNAVWERERGEIMTGAYSGTTEEKLKKFNDALYAAGLQEVLDETQRQIDAWRG